MWHTPKWNPESKACTVHLRLETALPIIVLSWFMKKLKVYHLTFIFSFNWHSLNFDLRLTLTLILILIWSCHVQISSWLQRALERKQTNRQALGKMTTWSLQNLSFHQPETSRTIDCPWHHQCQFKFMWKGNGISITWQPDKRRTQSPTPPFWLGAHYQSDLGGKVLECGHCRDVLHIKEEALILLLLPHVQAHKDPLNTSHDAAWQPTFILVLCQVYVLVWGW